MQEDTYREDGLNLYAYYANNPVVYFDPSGHKLSGYMKKPEPETTQGGLFDYFQPDKVKVPEGSERVRKDVRSVKSEEFKEFIRSQGKSFKNNEWKKIMETWVTPDGKRIEVHFWMNRKTGEIWRHK